MKFKSANYLKWDTHHHINPKIYEDELRQMGIDKVNGLDHPKWSEKMMMKWMDEIGIERVFMSISTPGVHFGDDDHSRRFCRRLNEYMASVSKRHPDRVGAFAVVPLPDVEGAIEELKYALDVLKLDGIGLLSNLNLNYLGHEGFRRFYEEADKRNTVIYIHPTAPEIASKYYLLNYVYFFKLDTTRTIIDFMRSGYHRDFPNIKFLLSHGGGVLPAIYPTLIEAFKAENPNIEAEFEQWKSQLFVDNALISYSDEMLPTTFNFFGDNHVVYGSDLCWAQRSYKYYMKQFSMFNLNHGQFKKVFKDNVKSVFKSKESIEYSPVHNIKPESYGEEKKNRIKYHYHCMPKSVIEHLKSVNTSFCSDKIEPWNAKKVLNWMDKSHYEKVMLSLEIPDLWQLKDDAITSVLRTYNESVAEIRNKNPQKLGAFGAVDFENVEHALKEIDYCLNILKLDGICIYVKMVGKLYGEMFDDRLLKKLMLSGVPVLVHPKASSGMPIFNVNYLDSAVFAFAMLYMDQYEYLKHTDFILTHTAGLVRFLARPVGVMHYVDPHKHKARKGQALVDIYITQKETGAHYLKNVKIDD
ncbi:amidohydrolase family protein [Fusibacter ferrireducens]|uniref:Amidohydrolase family protein n=1 Tax=Fusibacter ferrireducens TaxID=2785058 RepID=A0ABR9ZP04_9FIRM|nr:amidohydrolase family protein [Fusibacter ferrireducens]MBF4692210.1 amidohydrolase family protein [Fusibacter ferrireducens]